MVKQTLRSAAILVFVLASALLAFRVSRSASASVALPSVSMVAPDLAPPVDLTSVGTLRAPSAAPRITVVQSSSVWVCGPPRGLSTGGAVKECRTMKGGAR